MANITEEQKESIAAWVADYATLGEIQKRLKEELAINVTYMETRFLLEDLGLEILDKPSPKQTEPPEAEPGGSQPAAGGDLPKPGPEISPPDEAQRGLGSTSVTVDSIIRPGMMMSGRAVFADGEKAAWYVDQMGQLGLDVDTPGYRPSPENIKAFQKELRVAVERGV